MPESRTAAAVMDAAGLTRPVVVAASMGGGTAADLALTHPDRVAGLVLIGAAISGAPEVEDYPPDVQEISAALDAAEEVGDIDEVNRLEARLWLDGLPAPEGRVGGETRALFLEMNRRALQSDEPGEERQPEPAWPRLEAIDVPTLVMVGELDLDEFRAHSQEMANRIPEAEFVFFPRVAHLPHFEGDPACLEGIVGFVDRLSGS